MDGVVSLVLSLGAAYIIDFFLFDHLLLPTGVCDFGHIGIRNCCKALIDSFL